MSLPKLDIKQALDIFKWMNRGGLAALIPIGGVIGFLLLTRCGVVFHSTNYGDENLFGQVTLQDHPEAMVADDHGHSDELSAEGEEHGTEEHGTEEHGTEESGH